MNTSSESAVRQLITEQTRPERRETKGFQLPATVVIVAPPWPRSGAAWVIKNQIAYYRMRGFSTALVVVPFHRWFMRENPVWEEVEQGFAELGAESLFLAPLEQRGYKTAKYTASLRHAFRGTVLDWESAVARSALLPESFDHILRTVPVALLHVNYVQTLGFATHLRRGLKSRKSRIPIILETHDVQSHLMQERGELNPWTHKPDPVERAIQSEISLLKAADVLVHLSVDDFSFFQTQLPNKPHVLAMPAIDEGFISSVTAAASFDEAIDLLFVGQKHSPNLSALRWFFDQVWPLLAKMQYNLKIVGPIETLVRETSPQLFEAYRSCFVGPVPDLAPYYRSARCVIAPMVSGSGTSVKTIEALALSKPFVGTSKAFRGMPVARINETGVRAHDTPREFADAVVRVLADDLLAGAQSRAAYDSVFSIQASFTARDRATEAAADARNR
jgi:glycosyltransferase involved in cell wall biosynthesis